MTVQLDPILRVGAVTLAAIAERSIEGGGRRGVWVRGGKQPVAILILSGGVTTAFATDGATIPREELEHRCPGCHAAFERLAAGAA